MSTAVTERIYNEYFKVAMLKNSGSECNHAKNITYRHTYSTVRKRYISVSIRADRQTQTAIGASKANNSPQLGNLF